MSDASLFRFCRSLASCAALSALSLCVLGLQGCAVAERSWETTKSVSAKAWDATKEAGSDVKDFVLRSDSEENVIGFEYQWQIMTYDTRQIASEDLYNGRAILDQPGLAGRAACAVVDANKESIDIVDSVGSAASSAEIEAEGFLVSQAGNLQTRRQCSPTSVNSPAQLTILTDKALVIGPPMRGRALVRVGNRVFDSSGLYFKFVLDSVDVNSGVVTGQFEFMAQNQADANDRETLVVNKGRFSIEL